MIYTIEVPSYLQSWVQKQAAEQETSVECYVQEMVTRSLQHTRNQQLIALLDKWRDEGDEEEQRETFEALKQGLNANHTSGRVIFP